MKLKHYAQPNNHLTGFSADTFITEVAIGLICGFFSYIGYKGGLLILAVPTGFVALACLFFVSHTTYCFIKSKFSKRSELN